MMDLSSINQKLKGVFAPISTPFGNNEAVDNEALLFNLKKYRKTCIRGFLVVGSNGENKSLIEHEKLEILKLVVKNKGDNQVVIAGVMYEAQKSAEYFLSEIAQIGVDFGLVQSPSYFKKLMTDEVLYRYFSTLADISPIPLLLYNAPGFNGIELSFDLLTKLSEYPNIVGMKDSSGDGIFRNLELSNDNFQVMAGSISTLFPAMLMGSIGGTVSLANYLPNLAVELWEYGAQRNKQKGQSLHEKLLRLNEQVSGQFGVPGVKAAMNLFGFQGGIPRRPLLPLSEQQKNELKELFIKSGVHAS